MRRSATDNRRLDVFVLDSGVDIELAAFDCVTPFGGVNDGTEFNESVDDVVFVGVDDTEFDGVSVDVTFSDAESVVDADFDLTPNFLCRMTLK